MDSSTKSSNSFSSIKPDTSSAKITGSRRKRRLEFVANGGEGGAAAFSRLRRPLKLNLAGTLNEDKPPASVPP